MNIDFLQVAASLINAVVIVTGMFESGELVGRAAVMDSQTNKILSNTIQSSQFKGKLGDSLFITLPNSMNDFNYTKVVIVVGLGKESDFNECVARKIGGNIVSALKLYKNTSATVLFDLKNESIMSHVAFGAVLKNYNFNKYKTKPKDDFIEIKNLVFAVDNESFASDLFNKDLKHLAQSIYIARDLVSEPPNILYPEHYSDLIKNYSKMAGLDVKVFDIKDMMKLNMGSLLGVGQGSSKDARMVVVKWNGDDDKNAPPIAIVGKGVTFDTGGVSLKPPRGMWDMKYDMAGSAAAFGAIHALALRGAKVNAVAILGMVENAIDGNAQRPSDIVYSMSGQTIEVLNTDAEGRLILADLLTYTQVTHKPKIIIDLATLTGAIEVALGRHYGGLFSNDDVLASQLFDAGQESSEKLWRLPIDSEYDKYMDSDIADMKNISTSSAGAESITASKFLQRFIKDGVSWAHLDIASVAWHYEATNISPKGASGYGVYLLHQFFKKHEKTV